MIYSETAAQNYSEQPDLFEKLQTVLPAKRCGTTAEVDFVRLLDKKTFNIVSVDNPDFLGFIFPLHSESVVSFNNIYHKHHNHFSFFYFLITEDGIIFY